MDSLTQVVLGASVAALVAPPPVRRRALLVGAALGTLPDLDVLLRYGDAVSDYTYHRGFSHSLLVLSLLSLLLWLGCRWRWPLTQQHPWRVAAMLALPLLTHPLLDAFTTYGTQLLWPWPSQPVAWSSIFIIDPLFTLPLLLACWWLWHEKQRPAHLSKARWAFAGALLYLALGLAAKWQVYQQLTPQQRQQAQVFIAPMPFNIVTWRVLLYQPQQYQEAITYVFNPKPMTFTTYHSGRGLLNDWDSPALQRLTWFSGGLLAFEQQDKQLIVTDLRLGLLGYYPFSFAIAAQQDDASWTAQPPRQLTVPAMDWQQLLAQVERAQQQLQP